jgi:hypothetical protein
LTPAPHVETATAFWRGFRTDSELLTMRTSAISTQAERRQRATS